MVRNLVDILVIEEAKIDPSISNTFLKRVGFKAPFRLDVNLRSEGILVYIREGIPNRKLKSYKEPGIQIIIFGLRLGNTKWVIIAIYKNPLICVKHFLDLLSDFVDEFPHYERLLVLGDFNVETLNSYMLNLMQNHELVNLVRQKTCFKSPQGSCIDLMLTNCKNCFQFSTVIETGLSDYHLMPISMFKSGYHRLPPKIIEHRDFKHFQGQSFHSELSQTLEIFQPFEYRLFELIFNSVLNKYAPLKKKIIRGNNKSHVSKTLRKEIMKRSRLKNIARKTKLPEDKAAYKRQRNFIVKLNKKQKRKYFDSIDTNNTKSLWNVCKPYLGNKGSYQNKIILLEGDILKSDDFEVASIFNKYYRDITNTLPIQHVRKHFETPSCAILESIQYFSNHQVLLRFV